MKQTNETVMEYIAGKQPVRIIGTVQDVRIPTFCLHFTKTDEKNMDKLTYAYGLKCKTGQKLV